MSPRVCTVALKAQTTSEALSRLILTNQQVLVQRSWRLSPHNVKYMAELIVQAVSDDKDKYLAGGG
jgi:hypothetical protein